MARMREAISTDTFAAFATSESWSGSSNREEATWPT